MSATQDLLPFPKHDHKPSPVARTHGPAMVTRPLAKPSKALLADGRASTRQLPSTHPMGKSARILEQQVGVPQATPRAGGTRAGAKFAQARFARSVELAGSCLLIVTFLAAALFV